MASLARALLRRLQPKKRYCHIFGIHFMASFHFFGIQRILRRQLTDSVTLQDPSTARKKRMFIHLPLTSQNRLTSNIGSRKVVDDSDEDEVVETKAPAPKPKASSQPYVPLSTPEVGLGVHLLINPIEGNLNQLRVK